MEPGKKQITNDMRENYIDYGKGLLTIMVTAVHAGIAELSPWSFIRMIFFFFVTGYTFTPGKRSLNASVKRRFEGIMYPMWRMALIAAILEIPRAIYLGYGDCRICLPGLVFLVYGSCFVPMDLPFFNSFMYDMAAILEQRNHLEPCNMIITLNCHLWFLPAMFTGCVLFFTYMEKLRKERWYDIPVIAVMLFVAVLEPIDGAQFPFCFGRGCLACACMIAAVRARESKIFAVAKQKYITMVLAVGTFAFACNFNVTKTHFNSSTYADGGFFGILVVFLGGVSASILILYLMQLLERHWKSPALMFIGRNTMTLYLWNMILNTIFSILLVKLVGAEIVPDQFKMGLIERGSYVLILCVTALTVITSVFMARYKKSHSDSFLAKLI